MKISGHKTRQIFKRYNIIDETDIREAGRELNEKQKQCPARNSVWAWFGHDFNKNRAF
jgi:hypothetical protein